MLFRRTPGDRRRASGQETSAPAVVVRRHSPYNDPAPTALARQQETQTMNEAWIAERMSRIDASGIRKVFDLAAKMKDPIDLSIGQPDFDVPDSVKEAAVAAIRSGPNGYTVTQGIPELREKIQADVAARFDQSDRQVIVTSGTSGGLVLAILALVNPGEEVIVFDPYFVMYKHLVTLAGGVTVFVDTYPNFRIDVEKVKAAITPRTKLIIVNSPANPTGAVASAAELRGLAELARQRDIVLMSDEVYRAFCHDGEFHTPAEWNPDVLVVDGFSKAYSMTGWRLGFMHGPSRLIQEIAKLQQFTFVCAPHPVQRAGVAAWDVDISAQAAAYRRRRDRLVEGLRDRYSIAGAGGAFYLFPESPWGSGAEFVAEAIRQGLLIIPGSVFSRRDTHFRISYAAADHTIERGIDVLKRLGSAKS
jgi:aspartate aminotransferase/aminotransferase